MTSRPVAVLYTQDPDLVRKIKAYLRIIAQIRHVANADRLVAVLEQSTAHLDLVEFDGETAR